MSFPGLGPILLSHPGNRNPRRANFNPKIPDSAQPLIDSMAGVPAGLAANVNADTADAGFEIKIRRRRTTKQFAQHFPNGVFGLQRRIH
jgi:hypothetical protein